MKVLVVSHSYVAAENRKNITALQRYAEVKVAVPHFIDDRAIGRIEPGAVDPAAYHVGRRISLPRSQYFLASGDLGMKTFGPDIVHIEYDPWATIFWQTLSARARFAPRAKVVCTVKKNTLRALPQPLQAMKVGLARSLLGRVSHLVAINEGVRRIYATAFGVPAEKMTLMQHLGIDPSAFFPAQEERRDGVLTIGYCGRVDPHKGVEDLISAVADVAKRLSNGGVRLRLLGNGGLREELAARKIPWLELLPPVPHAEVADFMRGLDLFVMPARITPDHQEHDGHALMEAMACGVPTIGSTSGIIPELLGDGCGLVFPAGDRAALTERIRALLDDQGLRCDLAQRGLDRALHSFSVEGIAARKAEIYAKVLSS